MKKLYKIKGKLLLIIKTAIGGAFSIFIASSLGLLFEYSAGIITLLSIQNNKKDTLLIALKRILGFFPMIFISLAIISLVGKNIIGFGIFLLLFILLCNLLEIQDAIPINSVLCTHLFTSNIIDIELLINEFLLLMAGLTIGIMVNAFMPDLTKKIRKDMFEIEEEMKKIFLIISSDLVNLDKICKDEVCNITIFNPTVTLVDGALKKAEAYMKNDLFHDSSYYLKYLLVRKQQINILKRIVKNVEKIDLIPKQAIEMAAFFNHLHDSFHEYNNVENLTKELEELIFHFKEDELPQTRSEFENRAIIYGIIQELESFLSIKGDFVKSLTVREIQDFWGDKNINSIKFFNRI